MVRKLHERRQDVAFKSAVVSGQGPRTYMEDTHVLDMNLGDTGWIFGGVYDGHVGKEAATYAAENLHKRFLAVSSRLLSPEDAFMETYQAISDELTSQNSGACAANFLIKGRMVFFANVGDSRIIVVADQDVYQLTVDHRIDDPAERKRIREMGGIISEPYVYKGSRGLMPTRTIGDEYFKTVGIIATPSVGRYAITKNDHFLIVATDGLFDVMTNREVAKIVQRHSDPAAIAQELKHETLVNRRGHDNLTIIVLGLHQQEKNR